MLGPYRKSRTSVYFGGTHTGPKIRRSLQNHRSSQFCPHTETVSIANSCKDRWVELPVESLSLNHEDNFVLESTMLTEKQLLDVFSVVAREIGVTKEELHDTDDFSDLGLDDVLSKSIIRQVKAQLNLDLPPVLFQTNTNVTEVRQYLKEHDGGNEGQDVRGGNSTQFQSIQKPDHARNHNQSKPKKSRAPLSIVLQGHLSTAQRTIFLLPDGSGSAMVYSQFPRISDSVCVVAFNSPFLIAHDATSTSWNTSIEDLCLVWVEEIRRIQPQGPYIIGGYSAGGYYSFEVVKHLRREGQKVEKLVLIDSPCRVEFGALQTETIQYLSEHGLLGDWGKAKKTPDWFVKHFEGTIEAVERYTPKSMDDEVGTNAIEMPECFVIWATKGILEDVNIEPHETGLDLNVKITRFMLEGRNESAFGLHSWDKILPQATIWETRVPGNHFSLIHRPNVSFALLCFTLPESIVSRSANI